MKPPAKSSPLPGSPSPPGTGPGALVRRRELDANGEPHAVDLATALFYRLERAGMRFDFPRVHPTQTYRVSTAAGLQARPYAADGVFKLLQDGVGPLDIYPFHAAPADILAGVAPAQHLKYRPVWRQRVCLCWQIGLWLVPVVLLPSVGLGGFNGTAGALLALLTLYLLARPGRSLGSTLRLSKLPSASFPILTLPGQPAPVVHRDRHAPKREILGGAPSKASAPDEAAPPDSATPLPPVVPADTPQTASDAWADAVLPITLDLGEIEAETAVFEFEVALPSPCTWKTSIAGVRLWPETIPAGISEVRITLDELMHDTFLYGELVLVNQDSHFAVSIHGMVGKLAKVLSSQSLGCLCKHDRQSFMRRFPEFKVPAESARKPLYGHMIRRLPIYIVVGCAASMMGDPIMSMEQGIRTLHANLIGDPSAVESAWLSIICFGRHCEQQIPLTEISAFPRCPLQTQPSSTSNFGDALRLLANCVRNEVRPPSINDKGDWKPIIFILTDCPASDEVEFRRQAVKIREQRLGNIIAIACGDRCDSEQLRLLTDTVFVIKDMTPGDFSHFFKWTSQSRPILS